SPQDITSFRSRSLSTLLYICSGFDPHNPAKQFHSACPNRAQHDTLARRESRLMRQVACLMFLLCGAAFAQVGGTGSIQGTVTDPSGAAVTNANVTATNVATGVETTRQTTGAGFFVLPLLPAGQYNVTVKATGFETFNQQHLTLDALQV